MKKLYFISDAHLGVDSQEKEDLKEKQLLSFFRHIEGDADTLFIVGDLFDFWFDYHSVIPRHYLSIISALKHLTDHGIQVVYCIGNHDFWLGDFFKNDLNISVHYEPFIFKTENRKFYISHGDGLNKKDIGYRILKLILRSPVTQLLCRLMHPDMTFALARWFSLLSRQHRPDCDRSEPYINYARLLFNEGFDYVIFGHTHDSMILQENDHTYINTGEWIHQFSYAVYTKDKLELKQWKKTVRRKQL